MPPDAQIFRGPRLAIPTDNSLAAVFMCTERDIKTDICSHDFQMVLRIIEQISISKTLN